jgi:hypothetical protein
MNVREVDGTTVNRQNSYSNQSSTPHFQPRVQTSFLKYSFQIPRNPIFIIKMGMKARCQCSKIQFTTSADKPLAIYACHCTECRHQSSSAFGITAVFPYFELPDSVSDLVGSYTRITIKGRHMECLFCKSCGARLLHRFRDYVPSPGEKPDPKATSNVKGGCLEDLDKELMSRIIHIWTKHAIVDIPEGAEQWEEAPGMAPNPLER